MTAQAETGGMTLSGTWTRQLNRFQGCVAAECDRLTECAGNAYFSGCPIDSDAFHAFNPASHRAAGKNTILNAILNKIRDDMIGGTNAISLSAPMIAAGTGTAVTDPSSSQLQIEGYRANLVARNAPNTGTAQFYWYIPPGTATGTWTEWMLLAGNPTGLAGTGQGLNRWLDTVDKGAFDSLTGQYQIIAANP